MGAGALLFWHAYARQVDGSELFPLILDKSLFVGSAVAKLSLGVVTRAMMPFFIALFIVLLMVTYMPWLSLWLPRLLGL